jgi:hypothetical protein
MAKGSAHKLKQYQLKDETWAIERQVNTQRGKERIRQMWTRELFVHKEKEDIRNRQTKKKGGKDV